MLGKSEWWGSDRLWSQYLRALSFFLRSKKNFPGEWAESICKNWVEKRVENGREISGASSSVLPETGPKTGGIVGSMIGNDKSMLRGVGFVADHRFQRRYSGLSKARTLTYPKKFSKKFIPDLSRGLHET